jgi:hypothetical protein
MSVRGGEGGHLWRMSVRGGGGGKLVHLLPDAYHAHSFATVQTPLNIANRFGPACFLQDCSLGAWLHGWRPGYGIECRCCGTSS